MQCLKGEPLTALPSGVCVCVGGWGGVGGGVNADEDKGENVVMVAREPTLAREPFLFKSWARFVWLGKSWFEHMSCTSRSSDAAPSKV